MLRTTLVTALPLLALASTTTLTATEAAGQLSEFDVIVDVRSQAAYEQSHVQGAVLQSRASLDGCETRKVAFYCSAGSASQSAADSYAAQTGEGSQAYAIGTLDELAAAGVPTESGPGTHNPECATSGASSGGSSNSTVLIVIIALAAATLVLGVAMVAVCMRKGGSNRASSADAAEVEVAAKKLPPA